jgi:hypothetical protein
MKNSLKCMRRDWVITTMIPLNWHVPITVEMVRNYLLCKIFFMHLVQNFQYYVAQKVHIDGIQ